MDRDSDPRLANSTRSDFILFDGSVLCELKSICEDTTKKIPAVLSRYGISAPPGRYILPALLAGRQDADEIARAVWHAICSDIETDIKRANKQIRAEKQRTNRESTGLLVLVNDQVGDLHPDLLLHGIEVKLKKTRFGKPRFPNVEIVWVISEVFPLEMGNVVAFLGLKENPLVQITPSALAMVRQLNDEWQQARFPPPN